MIYKILNIFIIFLFVVLAGCTHSSVVVTRLDKKTEKTDTLNYSGYWTAMRCGLPEMASQYNIDQDKIDFADCLSKIKEGKYQESEFIAKRLFKLSKNDTIVENSKMLLSQLLIYQSKWQDYFDLNRNKSEADSNEIRNLLYPAFIGLQSSNKFVKDADTISIKYKNRNIYVPVTINGKVFEFLFDTGAQLSTIGSDIATEAGIKILNNHPRALVGSMGHKSDVQTASVDHLSLANYTTENYPCFVTDAGNLKFKFWFLTFMSFEGIIGWDIIKNLDVEIDFVKEKMIVRKPIKRNITERNMFWLNNPIVKLKSTSGIDLLFFLDLGAEESSFFDFMLMKLNPDNLKEDSRTYYGIGGSLKRDVKVIPRIRLILSDFALDYQNLYLGFDNEGHFIKLDGVLGNDIGKKGKLRIDALNGILEYK